LKSITFVLPKRNPTPVGGFKVVYEYANRFAEIGYDVNLIFPATLLWSERDLISKLKGMLAFPFYGILSNKYLPKSWFTLHKKINIFWTRSLDEKFIPKADYIFATACGTAVYVDKYALNKGEKYYLIQHKEEWDFPENRLEETYKLNLNKIVISKWLSNLMHSIGENSTIIHNGLDFEFFKPRLEPHEKNKNNILMMYHEASWKGSEVGIEVISKLRKINDVFNFKLFGIFPRPKNLPDFIEYVESPSQEYLVDLYNETSIFLGTSFTEGWGLTIAEAMQCKCAVVCTNINGYNEMVFDGLTGLLSRPGDTNSLVDNILRLHSDDQLRQTIAKNGYEFIQRFKWEDSFNKLRQLIEHKNELKFIPNDLLTIYIPTYNRGDNLVEFLPLLDGIPGLNIHISDDGNQPSLRKLFSDSNFKNISLQINNPPLGHDLNSASCIDNASAKFTWIISDKFKISKIEVESILKKLAEISKSVSVIGINIHGREINCEEKIYNDRNFVLENFGWHLTLTGSAIFRTDDLKLISHIKLAQYKNFPHFAAVFEILNNSGQGLEWLNRKYLFANSTQKSYWIDDALDVFVHDWGNAIRLLPETYKEESKNICFKNHAIKSNVFSFKTVLRLRAYGKINFDILSKDNKAMFQAIGKKRSLLFLLCLLPTWPLRALIDFRAKINK